MNSTPTKPSMRLVGEPQKPPSAQLQRPCFAVYITETNVEGRTFAAGTWMHDLSQSKGGESTPVDRRICDPLLVVADTLSTEDGKHGLLLNFNTRAQPGRAGKATELFIAREDLAGRGEAVIKQLMAAGLDINYRNQRHLPHYLAEHIASQTIEVTSKTGWHRSGAFVLPGRTLGGQGARYRASAAAANPFTQKGSLSGWQQQVGSYCQGNPVPIVAVCCALAGPLLEQTKVRGGGLHLIGKSSSGKSLAQLIAASVWGEPLRFAGSWDTTVSGMEIAASSRNDTVLILDEISRANPKTTAALAYMIGNGEGKQTMTREREAREVMSWRVLALSSGETSLADHTRAAGQHSQAGAELRMIDIDAGNRPYRAFDHVHGMEASQFHALLTQTSGQHHGHLGPAFVERLQQGAALEDLPQMFSATQRLFAADNAQAHRIGDRFAVMALAGELATEWGLTGWPADTAANACKQLFNEWLAEFGSGNLEDRQILQAVREYIEEFSESRFSNIARANQPGQPLINQRSGYYRFEPNNQKTYLFSAAGLRRATPNHSPAQVNKALLEAGALTETGGKTASKMIRIPGGESQRFYIINPEKLYPNDSKD